MKTIRKNEKAAHDGVLLHSKEYEKLLRDKKILDTFENLMEDSKCTMRME